LREDPRSVTEGEYRAIRNAIALQIIAHGKPGTHAHDAKRVAELRAVAAPLHADLRRVLVERLRALPSDGGADPEHALAPVTLDEATRFRVPAGARLPEYLEPKVARSCDAPLEDLVERGVIGSAEAFARVLPQVTAQVRAQTIDEPAARRLYAALYMAFRRRRGLL
jgi:hypothetical protein